MLKFKSLVKLKLSKKRGSPILEEILLIGIAILVFAVIFGVIFSLIDWASINLDNFFG